MRFDLKGGAAVVLQKQRLRTHVPKRMDAFTLLMSMGSGDYLTPSACLMLDLKKYIQVNNAKIQTVRMDDEELLIVDVHVPTNDDRLSIDCLNNDVPIN